MQDVPRFYCCPITSPQTGLPDDQAHHLLHVLRLKPGDRAEVFDGRGTLAHAVVADIGKKQVTLDVIEMLPPQPPPGPRLVIAPAIAKGERFDWLIEKCTELGAAEIWPVVYRRSVKMSKNPRTRKRWQHIAVAACKQSRQLFLPHIEESYSLANALNRFVQELPNAVVLYGDQAGEPVPDILPKKTSHVIVFIGPEGGMTDEEKSLLDQRQARPVRIAAAVLRIETAAVSFAALLAEKYGH